MLHRAEEPLYYDGEEVLSWLAQTQLDAIATRDCERDDCFFDAGAAAAATAPFAMDGTPNSLTNPSTPKKRPRADLDPDSTPKSHQLNLHPRPVLASSSVEAPDTDTTSDSLGSLSSRISNRSSRSNQSKRTSSPRKKEAALRATTQYPVHRRPIDSEIKPVLPQPLLDLLQELFDIGNDKRAVIPSHLRGTLPAIWYNDPNQNHNLFFPPGKTLTDDFTLRHRHATLQTIQNHSQLCEARLEHEAGWNELVHSPILSDALADHGSVHFRNITTCPIRASYNDPDAAVSATKIDYAMLLNATAIDPARLRSQLGDVPVTHFALSDNAPTPLAISIETKSVAADTLTGSTQLAAWVRAHFRHLEAVNCALRPRNMEQPGQGRLPALPLLFAIGSKWFVKVACRHEQKTIIYYNSLSIGNTSTLHGCYQTSAAIRRLADWAAQDFLAWWRDCP
ncbi:hypothetical protein B0T25DRAFT_134463 [Lasiosphaeria hispida]|uniref:PD-(D/E)XK nuclease-like domain-containing protein n=1 Tax=Lasiosphaeria hispida TaxID=260671 RepID=A0AAJ0HKA4_9PEZI|nr:hypothetical protein B0T25DRAFT_134463 [Lasiosphaeria hispida]